MSKSSESQSSSHELRTSRSVSLRDPKTHKHKILFSAVPTLWGFLITGVFFGTSQSLICAPVFFFGPWSQPIDP